MREHPRQGLQRSAICGAVGATFSGLAVSCGAFGSHALRGYLSSGQLQIWETAVRYQFYHGLALLLMAGLIACGRFPLLSAAPGRWIAALFAGGSLLFSGSLYLLCLNGGQLWGFLTPVGGFAWLIAWFWLAWSLWASRNLDSADDHQSC